MDTEVEAHFDLQDGNITGVKWHIGHILEETNFVVQILQEKNIYMFMQ